MELLKLTMRIALQHLPIFVCLSVLKCMLMWGYRSTDFEVHRNWLSIVANGKPSTWYSDDVEFQSEWRLDYPPLFAYFEWLLALLARVVSPAALRNSAVPVESPSVVLYQRATVNASDVVLLLGLSAYCAAATVDVGRLGLELLPATVSRKWNAVILLVLCNPGLLLLDHIHFQYNGMLIGLLLLVMAVVRRSWRTIEVHGRARGSSAAADSVDADLRNDMLAAVSFTLLVFTKHLFAHLAPFVGVYLLRRCYDAAIRVHGTQTGQVTGTGTARATMTRLMIRLLKIAAAVLTTSIIILAPVLLPNPMSQGYSLLSRLFPFGRGLTHSYWAPNAWAGYMAVDRLAASGCKLMMGRKAQVLPQLLKAAVHAVCPVLSGTSAEPSLVHSNGVSFTSANAYGGLPTNQLLVLPQPTPFLAGLLLFAATLPVLAWTWHCSGSSSGSSAATNKRHGRAFNVALAVAACWFASFAFGWHVHEKAAVYGLIPLLVAVADDGSDDADASPLPAISAAVPLLDADAGTEAAAAHPARAHTTEQATPSLRRRGRSRAGSRSSSSSQSATPAAAAVSAGSARETAGAAAVGSINALQPDVDTHEGHSPALARLAWRLSIPIHTSLLPLVTTPIEQPFIVGSLALWTALAWQRLLNTDRRVRGVRLPVPAFTSTFDVGMMACLAAVYLFSLPPVHSKVLPSLPFAHLMLMSVTCLLWMLAVAAAYAVERAGLRRHA